MGCSGVGLKQPLCVFRWELQGGRGGTHRRCERGTWCEGSAREEAGPGGAGQRQCRGLEGCGGGPAGAQQWPSGGRVLQLLLLVGPCEAGGQQPRFVLPEAAAHLVLGSWRL